MTAEEGGLRGSEYYATHPLIPPAKTAVALNYDALYPWGRAKDVVMTGAERTTVYPLAQQIAKRLDLAIAPDAQPEAGHYFRSDHFSFAHAGIPAFSHRARHGVRREAGGFRRARCTRSTTASTTTSPRTSSRRIGTSPRCSRPREYRLLLGKDIANQDKLPDWRPGDAVPPVMQAFP